MASNVTELAAMVVSAGAVAFALITGVWAFRFTQTARETDARWRKRAESLEARLDRADTLLSAHPGVVMAWDDDGDWPPGSWGAPKLYGAPAALASLLRFADASDGPNLGARILDGLGDYDGRDTAGEPATLRQALTVLRDTGAPFALAIEGPGGRIIEADGRPAGPRMALWLADPSLKSAETAAARGRLEEAREEIFQDPASFSDMWERTPTPAWRYSSGLKLQWANPAFIEAVEAESLDDAIGRGLAFDPQTEAQARQALQEQARVYHTRAITAGGARRVYEISCFPVSGGVGGVALDVTAGEETRAELEHRQRRQTAALNRVDDGVAIFSPDKELVFHNDAFTRLFALKPQWLAERPTHGALLDHLRERRMLPVTDNYEAWRAGELSLYLKTAEDRAPEIWRLPDRRMVSVAIMRPAAGGLIVIFRDITERLRLEAELKTRVKVQRTTLDKLAEGVLVFGSDAKLRLFNAAFQRMWGVDESVLSRADDGPPPTFDDIAGACAPLLPDPDMWAKMKARVTNPSSETRREFTDEVRRADGSIVKYVSRPLPDGATSVVFEDVTAERELASALKDRARLLEAAHRVRADFVGHVSRALRDPLQTILGRAELLEMDVADGGAAIQPSDIAQILEAGRQLNQLVETILQIAAIEANAVELKLADVPIRTTLENALRLVMTKAEDTRVRFGLACPEDIGVLRADPERVTQAVYNMLSNARRRVRPGGRVTLGAERQATAVKIWVEDDGPAVAADETAEAGDSFRAYDQAGAGLGLTLVREYVALHQGTVELTAARRGSASGNGAGNGHGAVGARVTCIFPISPAPTTAPERVSGDAAANHPSAAGARPARASGGVSAS